MDRLGRDIPLPEAMQGRWVDADDGSAELHIDGGEVSCFGAIVNYDSKLVTAATVR